ncbi:MAG: DUF3105 domain-containing protein [Actinomycetes bacterium]
MSQNDADLPFDQTARPSTAGGKATWITLAALGAIAIVAVALSFSGGSNQNASTDSAGPNSSGVCDAAVSEPLDPNSVLRLLPNSARPAYTTNPPTSGASQLGAQTQNPSSVELTGPIQVGLLAEGNVLVQYKNLSADEVAQLTQLATDTVHVAPNESIDTPVAITAWLQRQSCRSVDTEEIAKFVTRYSERGPQTGPNGTATSTSTP